MVSGELCDRVTHYDILKLVSGIDRLAEVNGLDGKDLRAYAVLSRRGETECVNKFETAEFPKLSYFLCLQAD